MLWLIFMGLLLACTPANKVIAPTVAVSPIPEHSITISTPTLLPPETNITPVILNKLEPGKEYIFYISYKGPKGVNNIVGRSFQLAVNLSYLRKGLIGFLAGRIRAINGFYQLNVPFRSRPRMGQICIRYMRTKSTILRIPGGCRTT